MGAAWAEFKRTTDAHPWSFALIFAVVLPLLYRSAADEALSSAHLVLVGAVVYLTLGLQIAYREWLTRRPLLMGLLTGAMFTSLLSMGDLSVSALATLFVVVTLINALSTLVFRKRAGTGTSTG